MPNKARLPLKLALAAVFLDRATYSAAQVQEKLMPYYGHEKPFTLENIETMLISLKAIGLLEEAAGCADDWLNSSAGDKSGSHAMFRLGTGDAAERILKVL